ncbi:hypothetical protein [Citricoccus sp. I39-566]|uniref:hypothetical protein n=1 Tax=Citricoccus sp. I39-566 TaxID=3073268 RepID=UPI00286B9D58|nr:hypothetical protein [Citricoccus sp. I39-566]WMY79203.1 hypothetical protein RE421_04890 [Citricoccus sp. I39-566]
MTVSYFPTTTHNYNFTEFSDNDWARFAVEMDAYDALDAARSPYTPDDVLGQCAEYPATDVRTAMASRSDVSKWSKRLVRDGERDVRMALAMNPRTDRFPLSELLKDSDSTVVAMARENGNCPGV